MIKLEDVERGYSRWAAKPHNAKWVRRIDGTPIANDICANIFDELSSVSLSPTSTDALVVALKAWEAWEAKLIMEGSDQLWCELGDLAELQGLRNSALYTASPSPISADAVVEACAKVADDVEEMRERLFRENGTSHNAVRASQANSIAAAIRAIKGTFPAMDGWKLVPIEPTQEMLDEACRTAPHVILTYTKPEERDGSVPLIPIATWRAMIAAAPSALVDPEGGV